MPNPLRFKVDENLPLELAEHLRRAGYEALTVSEEQLSGSSDAVVADVCRRERRVLITLDVDFGDIRAYPPAEYAGLVVLRLRRQDKLHVLAVVKRLINLLSREALEGHLWIVEEERVRTRGC